MHTINNKQHFFLWLTNSIPPLVMIPSCWLGTEYQESIIHRWETHSQFQTSLHDFLLLLEHLKLLWGVGGGDRCLRGAVVGTEGVDAAVTAHRPLAAVTVGLRVRLVVLTWAPHKGRHTQSSQERAEVWNAAQYQLKPLPTGSPLLMRNG